MMRTNDNGNFEEIETCPWLFFSLLNYILSTTTRLILNRYLEALLEKETK